MATTTKTPGVAEQLQSVISGAEALRRFAESHAMPRSARKTLAEADGQLWELIERLEEEFGIELVS